MWLTFIDTYLNNLCHLYKIKEKKVTSQSWSYIKIDLCPFNDQLFLLAFKNGNKNHTNKKGCWSKGHLITFYQRRESLNNSCAKYYTAFSLVIVKLWFSVSKRAKIVTLNWKKSSQVWTHTNLIGFQLDQVFEQKS